MAVGSPDNWNFNASNPCLHVGGNYNQNLNHGQLTHCNSENIRKKYIPRGLLKQLKNIVRKECKKWKALNTFSVTTATP